MKNFPRVGVIGSGQLAQMTLAPAAALGIDFISLANSSNDSAAQSSPHVVGDYKDIDAVHISLPDHQHAIVGVHAVNAGKDVYLQKPASLTIEEGRILSNAVKRTGRIFQMGSQQRASDPWPQFKRACELEVGTKEPVMSEYDFDRLRGDNFITLYYEEGESELRSFVDINEMYCITYEDEPRLLIARNNLIIHWDDSQSFDIYRL